MKKMNNYNFFMNWYGGLTEEMFLNAMRTNDASSIFKYDNKYGDCFCLIKENRYEPEYRAVAILENGYVDIEANFYMDEELKPVIDFCICAKFGEEDNDWDTDNFYHDIVFNEFDDTPTTDFTKEDWKKQFEKEMFDKLDKYCKVRGYDYTKAIKY